MRRILTAAVVLLAIAFVPNVSGATTTIVRTAHEDYVGGGPAIGRCQTSTAPGIAETCFDVHASQENRAAIDVEDLALGPVGYFWIFEDSSGNCPGQSPDPTGGCPNAGSGCGLFQATIPSSATKLKIYPEDPALATLDCQVAEPNDQAVGPTITGTVTVTFKKQV